MTEKDEILPLKESKHIFRANEEACFKKRYIARKVYETEYSLPGLRVSGGNDRRVCLLDGIAQFSQGTVKRQCLSRRRIPL